MKLSILVDESRSREAFSSEKQASRGLMESGASRGQLGQPRPGYPDLRGTSGGCPTCPPLAWKSGAPARTRTEPRQPPRRIPTLPTGPTPTSFVSGFPRAPECLARAAGKPLPQSNTTDQPSTATTSKQGTPSQVTRTPPPRSRSRPTRSAYPLQARAPSPPRSALARRPQIFHATARSAGRDGARSHAQAPAPSRTPTSRAPRRRRAWRARRLDAREHRGTLPWAPGEAPPLRAESSEA